LGASTISAFERLFSSLLSLLDFLTALSLTLHEHASLLVLSGPGADWCAWRLSRIGLFYGMMCFHSVSSLHI
jgi:hypothetical protein